MANPTRYQPSYSFTGWQTSNPSRPLPAQRVDVEFQNLKLTTDEIITALGQVRRSDGKLFNGVVDLAALSDEVIQQLGGGGGSGNVILATKAQAEAGTSNAVVMTPLRVKEAIAVFAGDGGGGTGPGGPIAISDVTGLQTALDNKSQVGHTHAISAIGGLQDTLNNKSAVGHSHNIGDVINLEQTLAGISPKAPKNYAKTEVTNLTKLFESPTTEAGVRAGEVTDAALPWNTSTTRQVVASGIHAVAEGSERNGPATASLGQTISLWKEGYGTGSAKGGEMDGLYIVVRQDGPRLNADSSQDRTSNKSDCCGILIDCAFYDGTGFSGGIEGATTLVPSPDKVGGGSVRKRLSYQIACMNTATGEAGRVDSHGYFVGAAEGSHDTGLLINNYEADGGYFKRFIACGTNTGTVFEVNRRGDVGIGARLNDGTTLNPSIHMRLQSDYSLGWLNAAKSVQIMNLDQNGNVSIYRGVSAATINTLGNVSASGNIIAGGQVRARSLHLPLGGDPNNGAGGEAGMIFLGPGGKLRIYDGQTGNARTVMYE